MVEGQIRPNRVKNPQILEAFSDVPRELFVPEGLRALSYTDSNIRLPGLRVLLSPLLLARLLEAADLQPSERVLDVACATGYSTAVMASLAHEVVGFESDHAYVHGTRDQLIALGYHHATAIQGDLRQGPQNQGLFDLIIFQGLVEKIPAAYLDLLSPTGRIVVVKGSQERLGQATLIRKSPAYSAVLFDAVVPALPEFLERKKFAFS
jgi:protein-L-isoaspartate(D-aspartate) O-methyltransferase